MREEIQLGKLLSPEQSAGRDAIHIAVAPVIAVCDLVAGQAVGLVQEDSTELVGPCAEPLGIVDPYLQPPQVKKGDRFYLCLYPYTVTGLRHTWQHPAFSRATTAATFNMFKKLPGEVSDGSDS